MWVVNTALSSKSERRSNAPSNPPISAPTGSLSLIWIGHKGPCNFMHLITTEELGSQMRYRIKKNKGCLRKIRRACALSLTQKSSSKLDAWCSLPLYGHEIPERGQRVSPPRSHEIIRCEAHTSQRTRAPRTWNWLDFRSIWGCLFKSARWLAGAYTLANV